jgi:hypothetical protein
MAGRLVGRLCGRIDCGIVGLFPHRTRVIGAEVWRDGAKRPVKIRVALQR